MSTDLHKSKIILNEAQGYTKCVSAHVCKHCKTTSTVKDSAAPSSTKGLTLSKTTEKILQYNRNKSPECNVNTTFCLKADQVF